MLAIGRGLGAVDQPDPGGELRPLRIRPQGGAGRRDRGPVHRELPSSPRSLWAGSSGFSATGPGPFPSRFGGPTCSLVLGGAMTAMPLLLFTAAAKRLPYSTLGFLQYVAPSLQFLLAVFVFQRAAHDGAHHLLRGDLDRARDLRDRGDQERPPGKRSRSRRTGRPLISRPQMLVLRGSCAVAGMIGVAARARPKGTPRRDSPRRAHWRLSQASSRLDDGWSCRGRPFLPDLPAFVFLDHPEISSDHDGRTGGRRRPLVQRSRARRPERAAGQGRSRPC